MKRGPKRRPKTAAEWQEVVNQAKFMLSLDSCRQYGLLEGVPTINSDRCVYYLEEGQRLGYHTWTRLCRPFKPRAQRVERRGMHFAPADNRKRQPRRHFLQARFVGGVILAHQGLLGCRQRSYCGAQLPDTARGVERFVGFCNARNGGGRGGNFLEAGPGCFGVTLPPHAFDNRAADDQPGVSLKRAAAWPALHPIRIGPVLRGGVEQGQIAGGYQVVEVEARRQRSRDAAGYSFDQRKVRGYQLVAPGADAGAVGS